MAITSSHSEINNVIPRYSNPSLKMVAQYKLAFFLVLTLATTSKATFSISRATIVPGFPRQCYAASINQLIAPGKSWQNQGQCDRNTCKASLFGLRVYTQE
ncbi:hypothetical protein SK128_019321 [Halocaridina rubra]|uniref:Uncharacterized protein n=1 Tax=Halocaridina rubra TaxID=373956 RepID=A0AAN8WGX6_HALRR